MFFKPTILKLIISIIFAFALGYFLHGLFFPCEPIAVVLEDGTAIHGDPACAFRHFTELPSFWVLVLPLVIIIYIILSFIQKE